MQFSQALAILAFAATAVVAAPPGYSPPSNYPPAPPAKPYGPTKPTQPFRPTKPDPPVKNNKVNTCSSGSPFCCSPSDTYGQVCIASTTSCDSTSICCNNFANQAQASQSCSNAFPPGGVFFPGYPAY